MLRFVQRSASTNRSVACSSALEFCPKPLPLQLLAELFPIHDRFEAIDDHAIDQSLIAIAVVHQASARCDRDGIALPVLPIVGVVASHCGVLKGL